MQHILRGAAFMLGLLLAGAMGRPETGTAEKPGPRTFTVPIEVSRLPSGAGCPVACEVDLSALARQAGVEGVVDAQRLRMVCTEGRGRPIAVQYTPAPQPRPKPRRLMSDTPATVSFVAEYPVDAVPPVRQAGTLTWRATGLKGRPSHYELRCEVPKEGRAIQVPYLPRNLHVFDAEGRATPCLHFPRVRIRPQWPLEGKLSVYEDRGLVTTYHIGPTVEEARSGSPRIRRPFLYPVNGPEGVSLTELGKAHDPTGSHAHHYSLWIAHAKVAGEDFWSERGGVIAHDALELLEDGPLFCRIVQKTQWIGEGAPLLLGRRTLTFWSGQDDLSGLRQRYRLIDVQLELQPAGEKPVELGQTTFGLLAARVAQSMTPFDGGGEILNARGQRNESAAHRERAAWIDQSGPVAPGPAGTPAEAPEAVVNGVALLDHPSNPNHPATWHCRNDGWAGAALCAEAPITIQPGKPLTVRYRIVLHAGKAADADLDLRFAEFAAEPSVKIGRAAK